MTTSRMTFCPSERSCCCCCFSFSRARLIEARLRVRSSLSPSASAMVNFPDRRRCSVRRIGGGLRPSRLGPRLARSFDSPSSSPSSASSLAAATAAAALACSSRRCSSFSSARRAFSFSARLVFSSSGASSVSEGAGSSKATPSVFLASSRARARAAFSSTVRLGPPLGTPACSTVSLIGVLKTSSVCSSTCCSSSPVTSVIWPPESGAKVRFLRTSTVTILERPCEKLWRTCPVLTVFLSSSLPGRDKPSFLPLFCSLVSAIHLTVLLGALDARFFLFGAGLAKSHQTAGLGHQAFSQPAFGHHHMDAAVPAQGPA